MAIKTSYWAVPLTAGEKYASIEAAARLIRAGKRVAFPTETVYGLGADAGNTAAVELVFAAKGRPADNPLIVHIARLDQLRDIVAEVDAVSQMLMDAFWPGPLSLVLPARPGAVSPRVTAGLPTVAVRMPAHPVALALIAAAGCPLAAPSANRSGRPSPTRAEHVRDDLDGRIEAILDAGPTGVGLESTVVEAVDGIVHILRPGGITREQLAGCVTDACVSAYEDGLESSQVATLDAALNTAAPAIPSSPLPFAPKSPGMKYKHYAPEGQFTLVVGPKPAFQPGSAEKMRMHIQRLIEDAGRAGGRTGVLASRENADRYRADLVVSYGSSAHPEQMARELYNALRSFDDAGITFIVGEAYCGPGIAMAVLNRLVKAAGNRVVFL